MENLKNKIKLTNGDTSIALHLSAIVIIALLSCMIGGTVYEGERVLYLDDLGTYLGKVNENTSLITKIFSTGANKTRYFLNFVLIIFFKLVGSDFERIDFLLQLENICVACLFYGCLYLIGYWCKCKNSQVNALCGALMLASSRFAYYSYTEVLGIMEDSAMLCAIGIAALLIKDEFKLGSGYWISNILYTIALYTHERYFVLGGCLILYTLLAWYLNHPSGQKIIKALLVPTLDVGIFWIIRIAVLGNRILDGTGGTDIKQTFSLKTFVRMFVRQILYLIGVNAPDNVYLNGIDPRNVPIVIYVLEFIFVCLYIMIFVIFVKRTWKNARKQLLMLLVIYGMMAALMISSSVTIRVEMRWLYVSYSLLLITLIYMASFLSGKLIRCEIITASIIVSTVGTWVGETFYRSNWDNLYYWDTRELAASLIEELGTAARTIDNLVIIGASEDYGLEESEIRSICSVYDIQIGEIEMAPSIGDFNENETTVLMKRQGENEYINVTSFVTYVYGINEDAF